MLLSAVSVLVVAQPSSEIPEGLMNNSVYITRKALILNGNRQMGRPRRRRFNQVQKANKGDESDVKKREGRRD